MKKLYENINDKFDYNNIKFINDRGSVYDLSEILNLDFENENIELYLSFKYEFRGSVFQCVKSKANNSSEIISKFNEYVHLKDGNDNEQEIEEMFDETNEVHFDTSYSISLFKINSKDFKINFKNKIQEWFDSKNDDYLYLSDFLNWLGYDEYEIYLETLIDLYKRFGGDVNNLETIFDEENITIGGNLISWYSYDILDEEYPQIGFRKLEVK